MTSTKDVCWLAGLLEGEGSFTVANKGRHCYPSVKLKMTDRDVVERAARILRTVQYRKGGNGILSYRPSRSTMGTKQNYVVAIAGRRAAGWMMTLYPLMGERRQKRIRELLALWLTQPNCHKVRVPLGSSALMPRTVSRYAN